MATAELREIQENEVAALKAIYPDEFKESADIGGAAWKKKPQIEFVLQLAPPGVDAVGGGAKRVVEMYVKLPIMYPKTQVPIVLVRNVKGVSEGNVRELQQIVRDRAKEMMGREMIYDLAVVVQEELQRMGEVVDRSPPMSLEEARTRRLLLAKEEIEAAEAVRQKQLAKIALTEDARVQRTIQEELRLRKVVSRQPSAEGQQRAPEDIIPTAVSIDFDEDIEVDGVVFRSVVPVMVLSLSEESRVLGVRPVARTDTLFVLREKNLSTPYWSSVEGKRALQEAERRLIKVQLIRHRYLVPLRAFKIQRNTTGWTVWTLEDYMLHGSLHRLYDTVGMLNETLLRAWLGQILEVLQDVHMQGIFHNNIKSSCIFLSKSANGATVARLGGLGMSGDMFECQVDDTWLPIRQEPLPKSRFGRKLDTWQLGKVACLLVFGENVFKQFSSVSKALKAGSSTSPAFREVLQYFFNREVSVSELLASNFFAGRTSGEVRPKISTLESSLESVNMLPVSSRFYEEFEEIEFLGKGGFGTVVKARNRLDGQYYAVKKVQLRKGDEERSRILREVMALSHLQHHYIVRYFSTWLEGTVAGSSSDSQSQTVESDAVSHTFEAPNDFISSSAFHNPPDDFSIPFQFTLSDGETEEEQDSEPAPLSTVRSTILYIQMEFCENRTLRDILRKPVLESERWSLFHQILDALRYIHGQSMIHRDLKPSNIFIDEDFNVKIGDFGLAISGHSSEVLPVLGDEQTLAVGTLLYVAPELLSSSKKYYTQKVDVYSLGIILFEMCYSFETAMERTSILQQLRRAKIQYPEHFVEDNAVASKILDKLLQHNPDDRPSSDDLFTSSLLPPQIEDKFLDDSIRTLAAPNTGYHARLMDLLFSRNMQYIKSYIYDAEAFPPVKHHSALEVLCRRAAENIFRNHGATACDRPSIIPRPETIHQKSSAMELLDSDGSLLQLPYDLTLPMARRWAKESLEPGKYFTFAKVARQSAPAYYPRFIEEVDFDIAAPVDVMGDFTVYEAETLKVVDDLINTFPSLDKMRLCYLVNHRTILDLIFSHCQIEPQYHETVLSSLSHLGQALNFQQMKNQIRSKTNIAASILDELKMFNLQDTADINWPTKKESFDNENQMGRFARRQARDGAVSQPVDKSLAEIFETSIHNFQKVLNQNPLSSQLQTVLTHLRQLRSYVEAFGVKRPVIFSPLCCYNHSYYDDGLIFKVIVEGNKSHSVFAAGGNYHSLVQAMSRPGSRPADQRLQVCGVNIAWERVLSTMSQYLQNTNTSSRWSTRRVDVLVQDAADNIHYSLELLAELWQNDIRAELVNGPAAPEQIAFDAHKTGVSWVIVVRTPQMSLKVKNLLKKEDDDVERGDIAVWLAREIKRAGSKR